MYKTILGIALAVGFVSAPLVVHAQAGTNAIVPTTTAPIPVSPLTNEEFDMSNPVFQWGVVSNADNYRLFVRRGDNTTERFLFTRSADGTRIVDSSGNTVCSSSTAFGTICEFPAAGLGLEDGETIRWLIGARDSTTGETNFAGNNSAIQRARYFQFAAAATRLSSVDLFAPRGNNTSDNGNVIRRANGSGPVTFHWQSFNDASSFRLEITTIQGNNVVPPVTISLADANCTTTPNIFDACSFQYDPVTATNNAANDFCWTIVPLNARAPGAVSPTNTTACYAALDN